MESMPTGNKVVEFTSATQESQIHNPTGLSVVVQNLRQELQPQVRPWISCAACHICQWVAVRCWPTVAAQCLHSLSRHLAVLRELIMKWETLEYSIINLSYYWRPADTRMCWINVTLLWYIETCLLLLCVIEGSRTLFLQFLLWIWY